MILHVSVCTNRNDVFPKLVFGPISIYWGGAGPAGAKIFGSRPGWAEGNEEVPHNRPN